jgi:hypothetical protein
MDRSMHLTAHKPLSVAVLIGIAGGTLAACTTEPDDRPFRASYAVGYEPPQLVSATEQCDHLVTHVVFELGDQGSFELSANVQDDCTRAGGGFTDAEVFRLGTYTRQGGSLSFTSDGAAAPEFTGRLEARAIVLVFVPGLDGLSSAVELRVPQLQFNGGFVYEEGR